MIVEARPRPPPSFSVRATALPAQTVTTPLDWDADPLGLYDWRLYYQSLRWLDAAYDAAGNGLDGAAYAVRDWHDQVLSRDPPSSITWDEHGMASRVDAVARFIDAYIRHHDRIDEGVLTAAATVLLSHLYALAVDACYAPGHNHGLMQDRTLMIRALRLPALSDSTGLVELAERRMIDQQIAYSVTPDFIHAENSPTYQLLFVRLLTTVIEEAYDAHGRRPPVEITRARDGILDTLLHLLQPNLQVAPFGDSMRGEVSRALRTTLRAARTTVPVAPEVVARVDYVVYRGEHGTPPPLDRVFEHGGYASFRERWDGEGADMAVSAHFKGSRTTTVHWHHDDTSFQIYGFGDELIVDSGRYANDRAHPLSRIAIDAKAHNLMVVNGRDFGRPESESRIVAHGIEDGLAWVQASHTYYATQGIARYTRSFVFLKPRTFVLVDSVVASADNVYDQHFHLHPALSAHERQSAAGLVARRGDGAAVSLQPFGAAAALRIVRGDEGSENSWFFPRQAVAEPAPDAIVRRALPAGTHHLPVVVTLAAPGENLDPPSLSLVEAGDGIELSVERGNAARTLRLPWKQP